MWDFHLTTSQLIIHHWLSAESINNHKYIECVKRLLRTFQHILQLQQGGAKRDQNEEDANTLPVGDRLLRQMLLTCAVEGKKSQLCDTTGSSGMEGALDEVWWALIQTSSGSWMDNLLHTFIDFHLFHHLVQGHSTAWSPGLWQHV